MHGNQGGCIFMATGVGSISNHINIIKIVCCLNIEIKEKCKFQKLITICPMLVFEKMMEQDKHHKRLKLSLYKFVKHRGQKICIF